MAHRWGGQACCLPARRVFKSRDSAGDPNTGSPGRRLNPTVCPTVCGEAPLCHQGLPDGGFLLGFDLGLLRLLHFLGAQNFFLEAVNPAFRID
jgi:hypothetical protein